MEIPKQKFTPRQQDFSQKLEEETNYFFSAVTVFLNVFMLQNARKNSPNNILDSGPVTNLVLIKNFKSCKKKMHKVLWDRETVDGSDQQDGYQE